MTPSKSRVTRVTDVVYDRMRHKDVWSSATAIPVSGFDSLRGKKYALLTTYRKSGEAVPSPVWFGLNDDGSLYFSTEEAAAKVRRITNNPKVRVAPCSTNGKPLGPPAEGTARVLPIGDHDRAERAIAANYGLARKLYHRVGHAISVPSVYVEVTPS